MALIITTILGLVTYAQEAFAEVAPAGITVSCQTVLVATDRTVAGQTAEMRMRCYVDSSRSDILEDVVTGNLTVPNVGMVRNSGSKSTSTLLCSGSAGTATLTDNGDLSYGGAVQLASTGNFGDNYFEITFTCVMPSISGRSIWFHSTMPWGGSVTGGGISWNGSTCDDLGMVTSTSGFGAFGCWQLSDGGVFDPANLYDFGSVPSTGPGPGGDEEVLTNVTDGDGCDASVGLTPSSWVPGLATLIRCGIDTLLIPDESYQAGVQDRLDALLAEPPASYTVEALATIQRFSSPSTPGPTPDPTARPSWALRFALVRSLAHSETDPVRSSVSPSSSHSGRPQSP